MSKSLQSITARLNAKKSERAAQFKPQDAFKKIIRQDGDSWILKAKVSTMRVDIEVDEEVVEKLGDKYAPGSSNLCDDVPNIAFTVKGQHPIYLTWNEAYNLGFALQSTAELAYFG